ncbi:MAG TPA: hypothetical protein VGE27_10370 [Gemmatimonas sp.]|uniref:hypothetical protein n=1 Tax=Gemmatimonas sp. TaxID=1962908 RepID=UPI002ED8F33F
MTRTLSHFRLPLGGLLFTAITVLTAPSSGMHAQASQAVDARFQPWIGCWRTVDNTDMPSPSGAPTQACVVPSTRVAGSVDVVLFSRDSLLSRNTLPAAGTVTDKTVDDCRGSEKASWTKDNARLIMTADLTCSGGLKRVETGMMTITPEGEWLQLQHLHVGGNEATTTVRFRYNEGAAWPQGITYSGARSNSSLRLAAGAPVNGDQVLDVAAQTPTGLTEAWLAELGSGFDLDGKALARLADRGMPPRVIDMMIALSNPQAFSVRPNDAMARRGIAANAISEVPPTVTASNNRMGRCSFYDDFCYGPRGMGAWGFGWQYGMGAWDPFNPWFGMNSWRLANRFGAYPYNMGFGGPWGGGPWGGGGIYYGGGPIIVVGPPSEPQPQGRAIRGRGYTRSGGSGGGEPATPRSGMSGGSSGGSSSGSAGSSGGSSSGSGSGRTAKPRPPGGM